MKRYTDIELLNDGRGVSEVVAVVLLMAIVLLGMAAILFLGGAQLADDQDAVELEQVEQALTQFDDGAERVGPGGTTSQRVQLGLQANRGTLDVDENAGHITVEYRDEFTEADERTVLETEMGELVYEYDGTTIAYQGGGVWRSDGDGSLMVSPPEITNNEKTLTLPVVKTTRGGSVHSDVRIDSVESKEKFPNATQNLTNKVDAGVVTITIESQYYDAWAEYFREETNAVVRVPEEGKVVIFFFGSTFNLGNEAGIIATSGPGELRVEGDGSYIDSYNSSQGPYSQTRDFEGVVKSAGNIDLFGGAEIRGDSESEGEILLDGGSLITGDATVNDPEEDVEVSGDAEIEGEIQEGANVPILPPLDGIVEDRYNSVREADNNDNSEMYAIEDNSLVFSNGEAELEPGEYFLENIEMENNETLTLNATNGDITIVVENYVVLDEGNIEITGEEDGGDVQMYIAAKESSGITVSGTGSEPADHFYADGDSTVDIHNDTSHRFQILAPSDFTGAVRASQSDDPQIVGVILAPTPAEDASQFIVRDAELFGAVVTGNLTAENNGEVHFDRAIIGEDVPFGQDSLLDYLYVSENEIEARGS